MKEYQAIKLMDAMFLEWFRKEIKAGNIEEPVFKANTKMVEVDWVSPQLQPLDPNKTISQGCEMENETKCNFCGKEKSVVPYMAAHEGNAICSSCAITACTEMLKDAQKTYMELDKAKRYVKLLEEKSGVLSIDE